jgi:predicted adenine nucleotide alpha hydrolase (AANH) superfamily ATPase
LRLLCDEFDGDITAVYYNPNIEPIEEYERRRDTFMEYAASIDVATIELPYDRTMLSKVMDNAKKPRPYHSAEYFKNDGIVFLAGATVTGIDYKNKKVRIGYQ